VADTAIVHPNREKPASKATRAAVILLLLVSAALVLIITVGGWSTLQGAQIVAIAYVLIFAVMAYYVGRWNRGVLPVASALAILLLVVAAIAAPGWFDRDKSGYDNPGLDPNILGLLTAIVVPVEFLLIVFAMRGFTQQWNVEVEVSRDDYESGSWRGRKLTADGEFEPQPQS
jgi:energy-coupling factor transporter transmembrane protein EcfT